MRCFLWLASYYRKFIRGFSQFAKPLTEMTKSTLKWQWRDAEERNLLALKVALVTAPVLRLPDFNKQSVVTTDAIDVAVGAILEQDFGNGLQHIAFASRKLHLTEVRYSVYERELIGIVWAIGQWKDYFQGPEPILIQTDQAPLRRLPNQASVNSRVWKRFSILQGYNLDIRHIPGKRNPADSLSRQSTKDALVWKGSVHDTSKAYVRQLRIPEEATEIDIQEVLIRIFRQNQHIRAESKINDRNQISIQDDTEISVQGQEQEHQSTLSIFSKRLELNSSVKSYFNFLSKEQSPYYDFLKELESGSVEVKKKMKNIKRRMDF